MSEEKPAAKKATVKAKLRSVKKDDESPAYGVKHLAKSLKTEPHLLRVKLRNNKIKKNGKSYGWDTKSEMEAVVKKLQAA